MHPRDVQRSSCDWQTGPKLNDAPFAATELAGMLGNSPVSAALRATIRFAP